MYCLPSLTVSTCMCLLTCDNVSHIKFVRLLLNEQKIKQALYMLLTNINFAALVSITQHCWSIGKASHISHRRHTQLTWGSSFNVESVLMYV